MAVARESENIIVGLNVEDALNVYLEPSLINENILQNTMGVYKIIPNVKNKVKMLHLEKVSYNLQPKTACKVWKSNAFAKWRTDELVVCDWEVMAEQCADEFDAGCLRNLQGAAEEVNSMQATLALTQLEAASLLLLRESIVDDIYMTAWFGNSNFATADTAWFENLDATDEDVAPREKKITMLRHCDGWWAEILQRVALNSTNPGHIRSLDTNDGTLDGNQTLPSNIVNFLRSLKQSSSSTLRFWRKGRANAQRPIYMLQSNLYQGYVTYLQSTGTEASQQLLVQGTPIEGMYVFDGHPVVEVAEWDIYDEQMGASGKNARAVFTALENLTMGIDAMSSTTYANKSIIVWRSDDPRDKGLVVYYAAMRLGMRIANPKLITVGYNSSPVFVTAA